MKMYLIEAKTADTKEPSRYLNTHRKYKKGDVLEVLFKGSENVEFVYVVNRTKISKPLPEHSGHTTKKVRNNQIRYNALTKKADKLDVELTYKAYGEYCNKVKGNRKTSYDQAKKKLNRNILLGWKTVNHNPLNGFHVKYGCLFIYLDDSLTSITGIRNYMESPVKWEKDLVLYQELNEKFGIEV